MIIYSIINLIWSYQKVMCQRKSKSVSHAITHNFSADANVCVCSSDSIDICSKKAFSNSENNFNLFNKRNKTNNILKTDPRKIKKEIIDKLSQFAKIENLRYNQNGNYY